MKSAMGAHRQAVYMEMGVDGDGRPCLGAAELLLAAALLSLQAHQKTFQGTLLSASTAGVKATFTAVAWEIVVRESIEARA